MRDSAGPHRHAPLRRVATLGLLFVAAILSCGKDVTGPLASAARYVRGLAFDPVFPPIFQAAGGASSGVVQVSRVHVVLHHTDGSVALDTAIDFPPGSDSLTVDLAVRLAENAPATGEPMSLFLGYIDAAGDTVFRGGPVSVTAAPPPSGGGVNPPVKVPVSYTGPGASAVSVVASPRSFTLTSGANFSFTAVARDQNGVALPGTPVIWNSLDPAIATITSAAAGGGVAQNQRGTARIVAQLLTGPADTVLVNVLLPASQLIAQSGNAQTGTVGTTLGQPIVVKVAASDGVGVAGTTVNFAVATGGGSVANASVVSDANGLAQTTWKLGTGTGSQSVTATAGTLTGSPLTFTATAQAASATKLVVTSQPANTVAGAALSPVVITAQDNNGNTATSFTGAVSVAFGTNSTGATLGGTTTVNAVAGVATFSTLAVNKNGTGYTLVASATGLTGATTNAFDIALGPPAKLAFIVEPSGGIANVAMTPAIVVGAQDSQGNPTPSFAGTVTLGFALNPVGASLGGTVTVSAVAGVATFPGISVSAAGSNFALSASATGLAAATSDLFIISGGVPTNISVASGGGQSGVVGAALPQPVAVKVADAGGNGVPGTTVNFSVVTGGGSVAPTSGVSDASGLVQTTWTLGSAIGAQSISATSPGLTGSPLTITATGTAVVPTLLKFTSQPANAAAGASIAPAIVVTAMDAANHTATAYAGNVTLSIGTNPGGATLGGTATVAAVGGVATFSNITLNKAGNGYTLGAASGTLTAAISSTFNIASGAAAAIAVSAGQAQSGPVSTALPVPLAVLVTDANANPVTGATVNWAVATGGGSVGGASSVTNASGVASIVWTLGPGAGPQSVTASSIGLAGSPVTFTANASVAAANKTWTGATNNLWATATNWSPAGVPAATDSVLIPVTPNNPTLAATTTVADLYIAGGATLTLTSAAVTLGVNGALDATGGILGTGNVALTPAGTRSLKGAITAGTVTIFGAYSQTAALTITGSVVLNSGGSLILNGNKTSVSGTFGTASTGTLTMTNAADSLYVGGNAAFGGGAESGLLTAGKLVLNGNFAQNNSGTSKEFSAVAGHQTILTGTSAQTITFATPDTSLAAACALSCFGDVTVSKTGGTVTYGSAAGHSGKLRVLAGLDSVFSLLPVAVRDSAITPSLTRVHFARLSLAGNYALDSLATQVDTIAFLGTPTQLIRARTYGAMIIRGAPTVAAGGFTTNSDLTIGTGGTLTLGGNAVSVFGAFKTSGTGVVVMNNAVDSLFVVGPATFAGGAESGKLTNGTLVLFQGLSVAGAGQFSASGSHLTYLVGPHITCQICGLSAGTRQAPLGTLGKFRSLKTPAAMAARRAAAQEAAKALRTSAATDLAGRKMLAAKFPPRADAARMAATAGRAASPQLRLNSSRGAQVGGGVRAAGIPILPYSDTAVYVAFADTTGNQFANVRVTGGADVNTNARAAGNVVVDTQAVLQGGGHLTVAGNLFGSFSSAVVPTALELFGVMSDSGFFSPDTAIFSGAAQTLPSQVGGSFVSYFNVVVNSPALGVLGDDNGIFVSQSVIIQNSGQIRVGVPDTTCSGCPATLSVGGSLETHGAGTLRMTDSATTPLVVVNGSALFAGGSATGLLTQGETDFYGAFTQSGPVTTSFVATPAHVTFLGNGISQQVVNFANPGYAQSHFGTVYLADTLATLMSNVFVDGQLQGGGTHIVGGQMGVRLTSRGANLGAVTFDSTAWTLADGDSVVNLNSVTFTRQVPDSAQFVVTRSGAGSFASPSNWVFSTVPTGAGLYVRATDTDGVAPVLTLNFIAVTPGATGGFVATSGGAIINWYAP